MSTQSIFTPIRMGGLDLPNRIVMAPLTRMRAGSNDHVPSDLQVEYYAQRASAGLIVAEATAISPEGFGWADTPGLWSPEQVRGWRRVTNAVHAKGGRIIAQLWHTGAISHPDLRNGAQPLSASDINPLQESVTPGGRKSTVTPRPMTRDEIRQTVADYARAARNAIEAGFDGVQILANYLYLLAQFLNRSTNRRTDLYGGNLENRARILFEVVEAVLDEVEPSKVGVKISPMHEGGPFAANEETLPMAEYAIRELNGYNLSHLLLMGNTTDFTGTPIESLMGDGMFRHFRPIFSGTLIANVGMDAERGNRLLEQGFADMVAFGRPYIANPDLVERLAKGLPLAEIDWPTVYSSGPQGYSDYPDIHVANF
ncbi:alkene reductase [Paraburkholderia sp. D1E]|uniref:alkene reductase n=1 Tax=Paraburkholderia sp. D1E TaxID=3461398 RepID=UPI0040460F33